MGAHDAGFIGNAHVLENESGILHHGPVGVRAHHDAHNGLLRSVFSHDKNSFEINKAKVRSGFGKPGRTIKDG